MIELCEHGLVEPLGLGGPEIHHSDPTDRARPDAPHDPRATDPRAPAPELRSLAPEP
jgi:hypothetical protein